MYITFFFIIGGSPCFNQGLSSPIIFFGRPGDLLNKEQLDDIIITELYGRIIYLLKLKVI